jgi:hypothetical protein
MRRLASLSALLCLFTPASVSADGKPVLTFTQDGKDLVVKTTVTANSSPHVLWTKVISLGDKVVLRYYVIQNTDLFVRGGEATRSQKQVTVEWRLPGQTKEGKQFQVEAYFQPSTAELKQLLPQLQKLVEEGETFRKAG